jgi:hypothetical protein
LSFVNRRRRAVRAEVVEREVALEAGGDCQLSGGIVLDGQLLLQGDDLSWWLLGHFAGPSDPGKGVMVEQQEAPGRVRLDAVRLDDGLEIQNDPLVPKPDPEVLKALVAAADRRQLVVELALEERRSVPGRTPLARLSPAPFVIVVQQPPVADRVLKLDAPARHGTAFELGELSADAPQGPGILPTLAGRVPAHEHLDVVGDGEEAAVEIPGEPGALGVALGVGSF